MRQGGVAGGFVEQTAVTRQRQAAPSGRSVEREYQHELLVSIRMQEHLHPRLLYSHTFIGCGIRPLVSPIPVLVQ